MADCVVQNDGSSLILLNDGSSCILLNEQVAAGVIIEGTHAIQKTIQKPKRKRPQQRIQLIPVEFTFWLISGLIRRIEIKLLQFGDKLHPYGMYTDSLRESFILPLSDLRQSIKRNFKQFKNKLTKESLKDIRESILNEDFVLNFVWLKFLNKRLRRGS